MSDNGHAARYRAALEAFLDSDGGVASPEPIEVAPDGANLGIEDLARAHADALSTISTRIPLGALPDLFLRSAMALAGAVLAKTLSQPHCGEFDPRWAYYAVERYLGYAQCAASPFSVLVVDVDYFRAFNRTFERKVGDEALSAIHGILRSTCREGDLVIRCGGDEFCVILPGTCLRGAMMAAERIRSAVEAYPFGPGRLTVSIGLVNYPADGSSAERLMQLAYEACHTAFLLGGDGIYTPLTVQPEGNDQQDPYGRQNHEEACCDNGFDHCSEPDT